MQLSNVPFLHVHMERESYVRYVKENMFSCMHKIQLISIRECVCCFILSQWILMMHVNFVSQIKPTEK